MASLHKHSSGRSPFWFASYMDENGKWSLRSTKQTDRKKALEVALIYERTAKTARAGELSANHYHKFLNELIEHTTGSPMERSSVKDYLDKWAAGKEISQASGTAERYKNTVKLFLRHLGDRATKPITAVTPQDIQGFLDARLETGLAPKTVNVDIKTLRSAFRRAKNHGLIVTNPAEAVDLPGSDSMIREVFTSAQIKMLVEATSETDWKTVILLGAFTGARLSDCIAMKWDNVDLANSCIRYTPKKTRRQKADDAQVVIPLHPDLEAHLSQLASTDNPEASICPELATKTPGGKKGLSESFKRIMRNAGIDSKTVEGKGLKKFSRLSFHSLRHTFNSALANAGVAQEIRMKLTGHSTVAINSKYTHHELAPLKEAVKKLPALKSSNSN